MRIFRFFAATMFVVAMAAIPTFAQRTGAAQPAASPATAAAQPPTGPVPSAKIAFVNTQAFGDEKVGITKFVAALKTLDREFQPRTQELQTLAAKIKTISEELQKLGSANNPSNPVAPQTIQLKQDEGERLQREFEYKKKEYDALGPKRYEEVIGPLRGDILKALGVFAKQRGITMILDPSKEAILDSVMTFDPVMDVTLEFIKEYNSKNPATASTAAPGR